MRATASRARKKAQQSEPVKLSDPEFPADIELSGSESTTAVKHSNMANDDFAAVTITEVSQSLFERLGTTGSPTCTSVDF